MSDQPQGADSQASPVEGEASSAPGFMGGGQMPMQGQNQMPNQMHNPHWGYGQPPPQQWQGNPQQQFYGGPPPPGPGFGYDPNFPQMGQPPPSQPQQQMGHPQQQQQQQIGGGYPMMSPGGQGPQGSPQAGSSGQPQQQQQQQQQQPPQQPQQQQHQPQDLHELEIENRVMKQMMEKMMMGQMQQPMGYQPPPMGYMGGYPQQQQMYPPPMGGMQPPPQHMNMNTNMNMPPQQHPQQSPPPPPPPPSKNQSQNQNVNSTPSLANNNSQNGSHNRKSDSKGSRNNKKNNSVSSEVEGVDTPELRPGEKAADKKVSREYHNVDVENVDGARGKKRKVESRSQKADGSNNNNGAANEPKDGDGAGFLSDDTEELEGESGGFYDTTQYDDAELLSGSYGDDDGGQTDGNNHGHINKYDTNVGGGSGSSMRPPPLQLPPSKKIMAEPIDEEFPDLDKFCGSDQVFKDMCASLQEHPNRVPPGMEQWQKLSDIQQRFIMRLFKRDLDLVKNLKKQLIDNPHDPPDLGIFELLTAEEQRDVKWIVKQNKKKGGPGWAAIRKGFGKSMKSVVRRQGTVPQSPATGRSKASQPPPQPTTGGGGGGDQNRDSFSMPPPAQVSSREEFRRSKDGGGGGGDRSRSWDRDRSRSRGRGDDRGRGGGKKRGGKGRSKKGRGRGGGGGNNSNRNSDRGRGGDERNSSDRSYGSGGDRNRADYSSRERNHNSNNNRNDNNSPRGKGRGKSGKPHLQRFSDREVAKGGAKGGKAGIRLKNSDKEVPILFPPPHRRPRQTVPHPRRHPEGSRIFAGVVVEWFPTSAFGFARLDDDYSLRRLKEADQNDGLVFVHRNECIGSTLELSKGMRIVFELFTDQRGLGAEKIQSENSGQVPAALQQIGVDALRIVKEGGAALRFRLPGPFVGPIVGKKGDCLSDYLNAYECRIDMVEWSQRERHIDLDKEERGAWKSFRGRDKVASLVTISGQFDDVVNCCSAMAEQAQTMCQSLFKKVQLVLPASMRGKIIGRGGEKIKEISGSNPSMRATLMKENVHLIVNGIESQTALLTLYGPGGSDFAESIYVALKVLVNGLHDDLDKNASQKDKIVPLDQDKFTMASGDDDDMDISPRSQSVGSGSCGGAGLVDSASAVQRLVEQANKSGVDLQAIINGTDGSDTDKGMAALLALQNELGDEFTSNLSQGCFALPSELPTGHSNEEASSLAATSTVDYSRPFVEKLRNWGEIELRLQRKRDRQLRGFLKQHNRSGDAFVPNFDEKKGDDQFRRGQVDEVVGAVKSSDDFLHQSIDKNTIQQIAQNKVTNKTTKNQEKKARIRLNKARRQAEYEGDYEKMRQIEKQQQELLEAQKQRNLLQRKAQRFGLLPTVAGESQHLGQDLQIQESTYVNPNLDVKEQEEIKKKLTEAMVSAKNLVQQANEVSGPLLERWNQKDDFEKGQLEQMPPSEREKFLAERNRLDDITDDKFDASEQLDDKYDEEYDPFDAAKYHDELWERKKDSGKTSGDQNYETRKSYSSDGQPANNNSFIQNKNSDKNDYSNSQQGDNRFRSWEQTEEKDRSESSSRSVVSSTAISKVKSLVEKFERKKSGENIFNDQKSSGMEAKETAGAEVMPMTAQAQRTISGGSSANRVGRKPPPPPPLSEHPSRNPKNVRRLGEPRR